MRAYIIRRVLLMVPTLFLVSLILFFMVRLIPGDVIDAMVAQMALGSSQQVIRAVIEKELGLDVPIFIQYGRWAGNIVMHGDFGNSLWRNSPVIDDILDRWPVTLELGILGMIIAQLIALPIGIFSALRQDSWGDYIGRSFAIFCIAVPGFWLATMIIVFPSIWWGYLAPIMVIHFTEDPIGNLQMFIMPAIVLGMGMAGMTMRMTRTMMLEVLRQDYIRTAWAKGLTGRVVIIRHALKNALMPVVTIIGLQASVVVGGTVIIEQVFNLPGMGRLLVDATIQRDYPVVSGIMFFFATAMVLINLMVDLTYAYLDPRVHYK